MRPSTDSAKRETRLRAERLLSRPFKTARAHPSTISPPQLNQGTLITYGADRMPPLDVSGPVGDVLSISPHVSSSHAAPTQWSPSSHLSDHQSTLKHHNSSP